MTVLQQQRDRFVDLLISYIQLDSVDVKDPLFLKTAVSLVLSDLPISIQREVELRPQEHRDTIASVVDRRWSQTNFRRKAIEAVGGRVFFGPKDQTKVFFSYRRSETVDLTRHIAHTIRQSQGFAVFFDQDALTAGPFPAQLEMGARVCDVFLLMSCDSTFERTHDSADWVRMEIQVALENARLIIPVLINDAKMPLATTLPVPLRGLCNYNAFSFYPQAFESSVLGLMNFIKHKRQNI